MNEALSKYLVKRRVVSENEIWDVTKEISQKSADGIQ